MQVVYVRKFHERDFVLRFGLDVMPFSEWAWSIIRGKDGDGRGTMIVFGDSMFLFGWRS